MEITECPECGSALDYERTTTTYVGYISPPGHNHDDNCQSREYKCDCGYKTLVSKRNRCPVSDCNWVGQAKCFCHTRDKVNAWPGE